MGDPRRSVDYDCLASGYDERYARNTFAGIEHTLRELVAGPGLRVVEAGCGTGHWLALLAQDGMRVSGIDISGKMLAKARQALGSAELVLGRAEALPWTNGSFDRVICINALHHFDDQPGFFREARRVLAGGGAAMTIGLDPHAGTDHWWIYDVFDGALDRARARYPAASEIRTWMRDAGFDAIATTEAEHFLGRMPARTLLAEATAMKGATSQLAILTEEEYAAGLAKIESAIASAEARGEVAFLEADLHLHATVGWVR